MAEFALGLTKTAVEGTVSRVKSAIDEEEKLKIRVRNDLVFITGEFQMMQSFLMVANKERAKNEVVRTWVRQIRDLAFDVEDCVELVVSLDTNKPWAWLWRLVPGCMAPPRPIDEAVAEIQQLKARVEDVSHRNTRYNLISDSGSNSSKPTLVTTVSSCAPKLMLSAKADAGASAAALNILREVWEAAGKMRRNMGDLKKLITNEGSDLEVISLWGSLGSAADPGSTDVIREAYNDPEIYQEFKSRAWIKLMHPFNPDEFLKSLLTQFYTSSHRAKVLDAEFRRNMRGAVSEEDDLKKAKLMQLVSDEQRYLVIVEQLSSVSEWDTIRMYLPDSKNGSRIVVTTQQLGLALSCTGNPYQVSELRQFSYGQSLCAFFSKASGRRSDMGELIWQLRCGGVISVWGCYPGKSTLVDKVYRGITYKSKEFEGVEFKRHNWVDIPDPFDLGVFSRHLLLNFYSDDLRAKEIIAAGMAGNTGVIQGCLKFLHEDNCLVVINGLNSTADWDLIKATFLSEPTRGCIVVITEEASVARYCVDEANRVLNIEDLDDDVLLRQSIKGCEYYGIEGKEGSSWGRFFSNRREEACDWTNKFQLVVDPNELFCRELRKCLQDPGVISLCGIVGAWKSVLARGIYYGLMLPAREDGMSPMLGEYYEDLSKFGFTKFSWVNVPHPFNLTDFSWRLLLDFHSDDLKSKENVAVIMMEGRQDPIEVCLKILHQDKCFVVIDGLRSTDDWDLIRDALLSEPTKGCILVTTNEKNVATYCVHQEDRVLFIDGQQADMASRPFIKNKGYSNQRSRVFSSRMVEACDWVTKFKLAGHISEWFDICTNLQKSSPRVISVWGIAGVGKSALVKSIYYTNMIGLVQYHWNATIYNAGCLEQVTKYSWVDVPHPFSLTELSRHLLVDFHSNDLEAKETEAVGMMEGQDPIQRCCKLMREDKCFVVIDGLRSTDEWDFIKAAFLSEPIKGCILVITNEENVATHCVDKEDQVINVKGLKADVALNLFTKIAWESEQLTFDEVEFSKLTTTKCGGLPKVIAAVGESCCANNTSKKWWMDCIKADLMGMLETHPEFHNLTGLFSWMQSYFDDCPDSLKPCIFYLPVFPLGHNIRRRRLLRRWIAEGYSRDTPDCTAEKKGEKFFSELVKLSIIQGQSLDNMVVCQVNGFFREYIISRPMQDYLVFALEGRCILNSQRAGAGQHLTVNSNWDRDKIVFESMEFSRLRSLTVFGEWRSFFISANINMRLLRVLDLEDTLGVTDVDLEHIGKLLPRLKFLSLRGCKDITRMPSSLGGLRQLRTLDIKGTSVVMLPQAILNLEKLQYIRAGTTHSFTSQPPPTAALVATPSADGDGVSTSQPPPGAASVDSLPVAASTASDGNDVSTSQPPATLAATDEEEARMSTPRSSTPCGLAFSWLSQLRRHKLASNSDDGVQFHATAAGRIGKFVALHTLGVINVGGGITILRELKKLTQLRKLRLSGINPKNWQDFCCAISGHGYLESLSVRLDEDNSTGAALVFGCFSDISDPPENLKALKVYGEKAQISPPWIKQFRHLNKVDLELTVSTQEDINAIGDLRYQISHRRICCVKPIQDGELEFYSGRSLSVLRIDCSYKSRITFQPWMYAEALVVHCSSITGSSLQLSGLENLMNLKEVWLKGSYSEAVKQNLQQKVAEHPSKPILKLGEQPRSS